MFHPLTEDKAGGIVLFILVAAEEDLTRICGDAERASAVAIDDERVGPAIRARPCYGHGGEPEAADGQIDPAE